MILAGFGRHQLKRVYSSASLWEAREILALLEQQRIPAMLLNENVAGTPGVLPFNPGMTVDAEVWVLDDDLADRCIAADRRVPGCRDAARRRQRAAPGPCGACREENPAGLRSVLGLRAADDERTSVSLLAAGPVAPTVSNPPRCTRQVTPPRQSSASASLRPGAAASIRWQGSSSPVTSSSTSSPRWSTAPAGLAQIEPVDQQVRAARQPGQIRRPR